MLIDATPEQAAHCELVQHEVVEMVNRLRHEGMDPRVILAGIASASVATVAHYYGPNEVAAWFARQSAMSMKLAELLR